MRLRTHRTRTRFAAAGTAVAAFLATLAGLIGVSAAPAGAGTNGTTTYEADCTTSLQAGVVAPFVQGLNANGAPDPSFPTGATFGASGASSSTVIGPVVAGIEQALNSPNLGMAVNEVVGSTDGTATGSFSYVHDFGSEPAAPARQIAGGDLNFVLPPSQVREVAEVATAFQEMGNALQIALSRQAELEQERRMRVRCASEHARAGREAYHRRQVGDLDGGAFLLELLDAVAVDDFFGHVYPMRPGSHSAITANNNGSWEPGGTPGNYGGQTDITIDTALLRRLAPDVIF